MVHWRTEKKTIISIGFWCKLSIINSLGSSEILYELVKICQKNITNCQSGCVCFIILVIQFYIPASSGYSCCVCQFLPLRLLRVWLPEINFTDRLKQREKGRQKGIKTVNCHYTSLRHHLYRLSRRRWSRSCSAAVSRPDFLFPTAATLFSAKPPSGLTSYSLTN